MMRRDRVLLTHRFFWPDAAPYGQILKKLALHLGETTDMDVHVFASRPSYRTGVTAPARETLAPHVRVRRCWALSELRAGMPGRLLNAAFYSGALFMEILRLRPALVSASTFPPVFAALSASLAAKLVGAEFIYHVQDIHPDISEVRSGHCNPGSGVLRWLDNWALGRAALVVVPGTDMAATLAARGVIADPSKLRVIPNCSLSDHSDSVADIPEPLRMSPDERRIVFAGNMGRYQDLERAIECLAEVLPYFEDTHLLLLGEGRLRAPLIERWQGHPQIRFHRRVPPEVAARVIQESNAALLSLQVGIDRVAYPSKLATYASVGTPVLAAVAPGSDLARTVLLFDLGQPVEDMSPQSFRVAIEKLFSGTRSQQRQACRQWHDSVTSAERMLADWDDALAPYI